MLFKIASRSLWARRQTVLMTMMTLAISLALLFSIEHIRTQAKDSFSSAVSGVDLVVGARAGQLNLLLYSVFRIGNPTNNIRWETYEQIQNHRQIEWTVPISLGDSHRGYRVVGTTELFFDRFQVGQRQPLRFVQGERFADLFDVVLGAEVARALDYQLGTQLTLSHGMGATSFMHHDDLPFRVVGVLAPTGTPVDKALYVSLEAIEAIHVGWQHGAPMPGHTATADETRAMDLQPREITAFFVGVRSRVATFTVQRQINTFRGEPLTAILPGVALAELWQMLSMVENLLRVISALVLFAALAGLITTLLATMREREREIAIFRATGARPLHIFLLVQLEVVLMTVLAIAVALGAVYGILSVSADYLVSRFGLFITTDIVSTTTLKMSGAALGLAVLAACVPAFSAYKRSLATSLTPRV